MSGINSLAALEGRWLLSRHILHGDGRRDFFEGEVLFRRAGLRLIQDETGTMTVGNQQFQGQRRYIWEQAQDSLRVYFDDMRPFHSIPLGTALVETVHLCDPDRYQVAYDFSDWPNWSSVWDVEGPRKDYSMTSHMRPAPESD